MVRGTGRSACLGFGDDSASMMDLRLWDCYACNAYLRVHKLKMSKGDVKEVKEDMRKEDEGMRTSGGDQLIHPPHPHQLKLPKR
jgi:hypothetical protein